MTTFDLYRRVAKRNILRQEYASVEEAIEFLKRESTGYALDRQQVPYTLEELEELKYAESIRSKFRTEYDYEATGFNEVFKDTDRELSGTDTDNSESSSERDN
jgi:hypothetical protein